MSSRAHRRRGFTLVEMILAIVVLGVGLAGVLLAFQQSTRGSAEPLVQRQLQAIAEGMLEEVLSQPYQPRANPVTPGCRRSHFNDVSDYDGYAHEICSIDGVAVASLAGYRVSVEVELEDLAGVAAAKRISVTASLGGESLQLVGWRTDWAS